MADFRLQIQTAINRCSKENGSDSPDWILAEYLLDCLRAFDKATNKREKYYGRKKKKGATVIRDV